MMEQFWLSLGVFLLILAALMVLTKRMYKKKISRFVRRGRLTEDELINEFLPSRGSRNDVSDFLGIVSRAAEVPIGYLRPTDRFSQELAPEKGWEFDDGLGLLPLNLSKRFGGDPVDYDLTLHQTIADLMNAVFYGKK
jgi:hypothetical protein